MTDTIRGIIEEINRLPHTTRGSLSARDLSKLSSMIVRNRNNTTSTCKALFKEGSTSSIELALLVLPFEDRASRDYCYSTIMKYADHDNWEVREYAADALCNLLRLYFDDYYEELKSLRSSKSENIRRSVVLSMKYLSKYKDMHIYDKIIDVLNTYMDDDSQYVRKNLGPFAIGDALIGYAPDVTLKYLSHMVETSTDEHVLCNIASVFTTGTSSQFGSQAISILAKLVRDPHKSVRLEALKSLKNVYIRCPNLRDDIREIIMTLDISSFRKNSFDFIREMV